MPKNNDVNAEPVVMTDEASAFLERMESQNLSSSDESCHRAFQR